MGKPRYNRKRVHAVRRAPDGSSFQTCDQCGTSVAILLLDMHECGGKAKKRRIDGESLSFDDQPRSAFCFFLESYMKKSDAKDWVEIGRAAFEIWAKMSPKERHPFVKQAECVNLAHTKSLLEEGRSVPKVMTPYSVFPMSKIRERERERFKVPRFHFFQEEEEVNSAMVGRKIDALQSRESRDPSCYGQHFHFESFASDSWDFSLSPSVSPR